MDTVVWLMQGEVPEFIYVVTHAHDAVLAKSGIDDSLTVVMKYKSGVIATIDSCRETTYGYDVRVEVGVVSSLPSVDVDVAVVVYVHAWRCLL